MTPHFGSVNSAVARCIRALVLAAAVGAPLDASAQVLLGHFPRQLSQAELSQIAQEAGGTPWVIWGGVTMAPGQLHLAVYLTPQTEFDQLRRGRMVTVRATYNGRTPATRSRWAATGTYSYAQFRSHGTTALEMTAEFDRTRPFAIDEAIDDATLVSLCTFIRSQPTGRGRPRDGSPASVVDWTYPISNISRKGNVYIVALIREFSQATQTVTIEPRNGGWVVTDWSISIA